MVCSRCKMVVEHLLKERGLSPLTVDLGEVEVAEELRPNELEKLNSGLKNLG